MKPKAKKEKKYMIRYCPRCKSEDVAMALGERIGTWECKKCKYKGIDFSEKELSEEEYLDYLDKQGFELNEIGEPKTIQEKK
jgi:transposase-like protein